MGPTTTRNTERLAGNLLRLARAKAGVTQAQLAELAEVPRSTVERIEAGTRQPSLLTLSKLLAAVDLEMRVRVDDYDDHDDILDARYAAMSSQQREATDRRHNALVALVDAGAASPA
ncbi:helix-turn-helix transcriptional regulator [Modestobacter marinus]|uniref:helix-turn-helix transcriptional regulator n=1 Tax=Modestobacter marinus TaxID=477641 RepID=UPI00201B1B92|nr:helix-turn-helix transcriptional regulator [Modestobacter marinus]